MKSTYEPLTQKVLGADVELMNYLDSSLASDTGPQASRLLLRHVPGVPGYGYGSYESNPQDIGRKWLSNGGCFYIDLDHLEGCIPEVTGAKDFVAALHAMFRIAEGARKSASRVLRDGVTVHALACNSDGQGNSFGSHLNFLISKECYESIFNRRLHYLLWLASHHASSNALIGQGKVGSENGMPPVDYQLSQRADFLETITGIQTTIRRPIVNARNESLCGLDSPYARFHHIPCDVNLSQVANFLKVGVLQILLCMVEDQSCLIDPDAILDAPIEACHAYSHDPDLNIKRLVLSGEVLNAVDHQRLFLDTARQYVESGACDAAVPHAREILRLWQETLDMLAARDWDGLSRRLDWVLKRRFLEEVMADNPAMTWKSPEIKHLDLFYGSLNPDEGIYWSLERAGHVDRIVSERDVLRFMIEPPSDTRAFTRGNLVRAFGKDRIADVDWDRMRVRLSPSRGYFAQAQTVRLDDPTTDTRAKTGALFRLWREGAISEDAVLGALAPTGAGYSTYDSASWGGARYGTSRTWSYGSATTNGIVPWG